MFVAASCLSAQTQATAPMTASPTPSASPAANGVQQSPSLQSVPRVPGVAAIFEGFNAGVNYSAVHNTSIGWFSAVTPALSWAFNSRYSADVSTSVYFKRRYAVTTTSGGTTKQTIVEDAADAGDTLIGLHASFAPAKVEDTVTATLSLPSGDVKAGLGTGQVTFDFTNHLEKFKGPAGFFLDLGAGNSSYLFNNAVDRNSRSLGGLAHFMTGVDGWVAGRVFVEQVVYEQLPFGSQTIYARNAQNSPGAPPQPPSATTVSTGASEDNGLTTYFGVPAGGNVTLSGYYNRSLRQHSNTISFGVTWVLRGSNRKWRSLVDRALEEAERAKQ